MGKNKKQDLFQLNIKGEPTKIQKQVLNFLKTNNLSLLTGDPGTAKTFMAVYHGLTLLTEGAIKEIVLAKPLQETGKSMGFLPGTEKEKYLPYLDSFISAVDKILSPGAYDYLISQKKIRFEPVNFIRGTTFEYSFVILDEAQSMTLHELIAYSTRLGSSSNMVIMGDVYQSDIKNSGLPAFRKIITGIPGVGQMELGDEYQMRSGLILEIYKNFKKFLNETNVFSNS